MSDIVLSCEHVSAAYNGKEVLHDVNFQLHEGDYLAIVGENGSGKSTLMNVLLGLKKSEVAGKVWFSDSAGSVGYLPQQSELKKVFPASVWEVALSGAHGRMGMLPYYRKEEKERATWAIERVGMIDKKNRAVRELSGGQRQRILLARALVAAKKVLLLDEPVTGLDPEATQDMYHMVRDLNSQEGMTILMISHDLGEVLNYATNVLSVGEKVQFSSVEDYVAASFQEVRA